MILWNLKKAYTRWLFKRYGTLDSGCILDLHFKNVPVLFRLCPLFSPSIYRVEEGKQLVDIVAEGMRLEKEAGSNATD